MTIPYVPHRFIDTENCDVERVNDDLQAIAADIRESLGKRYTHACSAMYPLAGITNALTDAERRFAVRAPNATTKLAVSQIELSIYAAAGVTWTLTCSNTNIPTLVVETVDTTKEGYAILSVPIAIEDSAADVTWTLSASGASTIVAGWLTFTFRNDRGNQGTSHAPYVPTLLNALSSTDAATINAQTTLIGAAVVRDAANDVDLRVEVFAVRALAVGASRTWRLPQGNRRGLGTALLYICATAADQATFTVNASSANLVGTGTANLVKGSLTVAIAGGGDPTVAGDDDIVTIAHTAGAGAIEQAYIVLFWS